MALEVVSGANFGARSARCFGPDPFQGVLRPGSAENCPKFEKMLDFVTTPYLDVAAVRLSFYI